MEEASFFRMSILNQTGVGHLSLSDYAEIRDEACAGDINEVAQFTSIAARWGLHGEGALAVAISARNVCPEQFTDTMFQFDNVPSAGPANTERFETESSPFDDRIDLTIIDTSGWSFVGDEAATFGPSSLEFDATVDHFANAAFAPGWTVHDVLGPVTDISGQTYTSIDISGDGFSGSVTVLDGGPQGVFASVSIIDGTYPIPQVVPDPNPELDGEADCLDEPLWIMSSTLAPGTVGTDTPEEALRDALAAHQPDRASFTMISDRRASIVLDGREIATAHATQAPAGGYAVISITGCGEAPT